MLADGGTEKNARRRISVIYLLNFDWSKVDYENRTRFTIHCLVTVSI
jgi:hypothetical protein